MKISLSVDSYKGVDGSSLSPTRCSQIVQVYEMLEDLGEKRINYLDIQEEAAKRKLFGKTGAKSAVRTFFPLLRKVHFVDYEGVFPANRCFTDLGYQFVLASRALDNVTDDTPNKEEIVNRLNRIKGDLQKQGLIMMYNDPEYRQNNMWIVLKLLKEFRIIHWNYFLYTLHCLEYGKSIEEALMEIKEKKDIIREATFINKEGNVLPNTCYSYMRSFLEEANLINKISPFESKLSEEADKFFSLINI